MAVYVDSAAIPFRQMMMCHMVADTTEELNVMAERIGMSLKWLQYPGTYREHYDISQAMRAQAVAAGAIEITRSELGRFLRRKRQVI